MSVVLAFLSNTLANFVIGLLLAKFLGPDEYGRFAVAMALAVLVQTVAFDWTRLAATRFYSERVREAEPGLRATIDVSLGLIVLALAAGTAAVEATGLVVPVSRTLFALAIATAVVNAAFDLQAALLRARFRNGTYARLVLGKNLLSLFLTIGGAAWFGSAAIALLGVVVSLFGALLGIGPHLFDAPRQHRRASPLLAGRLLRYAAPIVLANLAFQSIPFLDRVVIAQQHGYAASGQFSFAYDIGLRIVSAIGSMLDVLLFQIAVRADEQHGSAQAKRQIGDNIGLVLAVLAPACAGCWLVLPSFEALVAPAEFRGAFSATLALLLPGLFCYGLFVFALQPLFLIRKTTAPLVAVAVLAGVVNGGWIVLHSGDLDPGRAAVGASLSLALGLGLLVLVALPTRPVWPRARDVAASLAATVVMVVSVRILPSQQPGLLLMLAQVTLGAGTYALSVFAFDICHARAKISALLYKFFPTSP